MSIQSVDMQANGGYSVPLSNNKQQEKTTEEKLFEFGAQLVFDAVTGYIEYSLTGEEAKQENEKEQEKPSIMDMFVADLLYLGITEAVEYAKEEWNKQEELS